MRWKTTHYFEHIRDHPEVTLEHAIHAVEHATRREEQTDGRIRYWGFVPELGRYVRVVVLSDDETIHNAFIDRGFRP